MEVSSEKSNKTYSKNGIIRRWALFLYDALLLIASEIFIIGYYPSREVPPSTVTTVHHAVILFVFVFAVRLLFGVYRQIWRYGKSSVFIRLIVADTVAGVFCYAFCSIAPIASITFIHLFATVILNLVLTIVIRLVYQFLYEFWHMADDVSTPFWRFIRIISGLSFDPVERLPTREGQGRKIRVAIIGAGQIGVMLAEELIKSSRSPYVPICFVDIDRAKTGREIFGIPVYSEDEAIVDKISQLGVQEVIVAIPQATAERKKDLYEHYKKTGCKVKLYDHPVMHAAEGGRRHLREFDIEDLLFRQPIEFTDEKTDEYYRDKVILITGGGGSIGSELCRQIAKMKPKHLIVLDICENGAYNIQQELKIAYSTSLELSVEIVSVCDRAGLEKVFDTYRPDVVLHAAAHKHVPLMEHNVCEAVKNNVFGTLNTVELSEKYKIGRFIMISTDKAVNPTNVMGATKRMCEMLVQSYSRRSSETLYSVTRFGNVLGSDGSVIPLFKKQIMNGGPVTLTDKRIIRYFMTIPEASQLVLQSGRLAKNGELFVLDMGKPIKILELAESMIRLVGYEPYRDINIIETGLRPGEKLYEELLVRPEELIKTENNLIFIERVIPEPYEVISEKLDVLREAVLTESDEAAKNALISVIPTYHDPDTVNKEAEMANEMMMCRD